MPVKEERRTLYKSKCACGNGYLSYYEIEFLNDYGHKRVEKTPLEIHCDYCKQNYNYVSELYLDGYLMPIGLSFPKEIPDLNIEYQLTPYEEFVNKHSQEEINMMIKDMETHRYLGRLTYQPALEYAYDYLWRSMSRKKSLEPMIASLHTILKNYDSLYASYWEKKPYVEAYNERKKEYSKKYREVEDKCFYPSFELESVEECRNNEIDILQQPQSETTNTNNGFQKQPRYHESWKVDSTGNYWDTLYIEKCIDSNCEVELSPISGWPEKYIVKKYLCKCTLCGNVIEAYSSDFKINYEDGIGHYPAIQCKCHVVSSFEAKTMDILNLLGVPYAREVSFDGLVGDLGNPLRFDFVLFMSDSSHEICKNNIRFLLELHGPHHYKQGEYDQDGNFIEDKENLSIKAREQFERQKRYDAMKHEYCEKNGIPLEIIKYSSSSFGKVIDTVKRILEKHGYNHLDIL